MGLNFEVLNLSRGLTLAAKCDDEDAKLLVSLFPRGPPADAVQVKAVLLVAGQRDARCLAWAFVFLPRSASLDELWPAAAQGYPLAMAWLCTHLSGPQSRTMAQEAAERGEPVAMEFLVGLPELSDEERRRWCERAAALGNAPCLLKLSRQAIALDQRLALQLRAAECGLLYALVGRAPEYLSEFLQGRFPAEWIYKIGRVFERRIAYGFRPDNQMTAWQRQVIQRCRAFYSNWASSARARVLAWLWCARQLRVHKDVARLIAGLVRSDTIELDFSQLDDDELASLLFEAMKMPSPLSLTDDSADVILCFGSDDVSVAVHAAGLYLRGEAPLILFSGACGRGTVGAFGDRSEAAAFAQVAVARGVPRDAILLEERATNSGENCVFSCDLLRERGISARRLIVVQKPFMEKRTYATLMKQWPDAHALQSVRMSSKRCSFREYVATLSSKQSVVEMMVGDMQRMRLYAERGFQIPMPVEERVWAAHLELIRRGYGKHVLK